MMNAIFRAIRQGISAYMTDTTRWIVAAHYPGPLPDEARTGDEWRVNEVSGLPPRSRRGCMLGRKNAAKTKA